MKLFLLTFFVFLVIQGKAQDVNPDTTDPKIFSTIPTKLGLPFGTIGKLEVEIYDGENLQLKAYAMKFLLKVKSVNGKKMARPVLLTFVDETGQLALDDDTLYKWAGRAHTDTLSQRDIVALKKSYVGKTLVVMAYETGRFEGIPERYFEYQPLKADRDFYFEHFLIVVSVIARD